MSQSGEVYVKWCEWQRAAILEHMFHFGSITQCLTHACLYKMILAQFSLMISFPAYLNPGNWSPIPPSWAPADPSSPSIHDHITCKPHHSVNSHSNLAHTRGGFQLSPMLLNPHLSRGITPVFVSTSIDKLYCLSAVQGTN